MELPWVSFLSFYYLPFFPQVAIPNYKIKPNETAGLTNGWSAYDHIYNNNPPDAVSNVSCIDKAKIKFGF